MRNIGELIEAKRAHYFLSMLRKLGIDAQIQAGSSSFKIWVHHEDHVPRAKSLLEEFHRQQIPQDFTYDPTKLSNLYTVKENLSEEQVIYDDISPSLSRYQNSRRSPSYFITKFVLVLCFSIMLGVNFVDPHLSYLFFIEKLSSSYSWKGMTHYWYTQSPVPWDHLFIDVRSGDFWRLFSPAFLHFEWVHIIVNATWFWGLARPIEERVGPWRFSLFILLAAVFSNCIQYLFQGPYFVGLSGVVAALLSFTKTRNTLAPWEAYPLLSITFKWLVLFMFALAGVDTAFFLFAQYTGQTPISLNIAHIAHFSGLFFGWAIAHVKFWKERVL